MLSHACFDIEKAGISPLRGLPNGGERYLEEDDWFKRTVQRIMNDRCSCAVCLILTGSNHKITGAPLFTH